ncbi:acetylornithine deacetylase [Gluconacetobacter takamatsuzukensis]|uniref:Acetylornithine deacetylase n=1 Tax=Gluconacetobacter takamatsuzukensis TaxID=1286190 RepID=A0A7W4KFN6_9PROT|nr:acetylornithine deacetylase [Gluconacetobacter takamatsuzukensis]MBB2206072.1 acetylornithine deacetylase [Gluconacetobacter takamatsuzukensis]
MSQIPRDATLDWLACLIAHRSVSSLSNMTLIDDVAAHFHTLGLDVRRTTNDEGTKANLFATLPGRAGAYENGLVLSGHTDVVPVEGQDWASDPFTMSIRNGRVHGRGACDMKGFLGVMLGLSQELGEHPPLHPVHFALSFDEELGCLGAPLMIRDIVAKGYRPRACIVGEPTEMGPVIAHKASRVFECHVRGKACHSSRPQDGVNAITYASRIVAFLHTLGDRIRLEEGEDPAFDPPYGTLVVGTIRGGVATNSVPEACTLTFTFRTLPPTNAARIEDIIRTYITNDILPDMQQEDPTADVTLHRRASVPAMQADHCEAVTSMIALLDKTQESCVSYGTEAGLFQEASIPTLVCGPGSILQAHRADEYVTLDQLAQCEAWLRKVIARDK